MTMLEKCAQAACVEDGQTWDELDEFGLIRFTAVAQSVIEALMEPNLAMIETMGDEASLVEMYKSVLRAVLDGKA